MCKKRSCVTSVLYTIFSLFQVLVHIIDRQTWKPIKTRYMTEPFFFMHVANAYEDGDHIVLDIPTYKDSSLLHNMFISTLRVTFGFHSVGVSLVVVVGVFLYLLNEYLHFLSVLYPFRTF